MNPIYGSAGLLCSGNWQRCHEAVEAVLAGAPIVQVALEADESTMSPPLKACDIRHVSKDESSAASRDLGKPRTRGKFKRAAKKPKAGAGGVEAAASVETEAAEVIWSWSNKKELARSPSHDSVVSRLPSRGGESGEGDSGSVQTVEESLVVKKDERADVGLELSLGFEPIVKAGGGSKGVDEMNGSSGATCEVKLGLNFLGGA